MAEKKDEKKDQEADQTLDEIVAETLTSLPENVEEKYRDLIGLFQEQCDTIRQKPPIDWMPYLEHNFITQKDFSFVNGIQYAKSREERNKLLEYFKDEAYGSILKVVQIVPVVVEIQKFLLIVFDLILEDITRVEHFFSISSEPWKCFQDNLQCNDDFTRNITSRIITKLITGRKAKPQATRIKFFLHWLKNELYDDNEYLSSVSRCLQRLLQWDDYRITFMAMSGILKMIKILSSDLLRPQTQYQFCFCVWVSTFNSYIAEKIHRSGTIPIMTDILKGCPAEISKLPRVVLATFRNLLEKPREESARRHNALMMIQCQMICLMDIIEKKADLANDEEYMEDFQIVSGILNERVKDLSSFDEYLIELKSGRLTWSVVHKSKRFWMENAEKLNDNDYELLKILIYFLEEGKKNAILSIAAYDLREYMRHYSRGRQVVHELGGKEALLKLLTHQHPVVKYHALKALQVLMLVNYDTYADYEVMDDDDSKGKRKNSRNDKNDSKKDQNNSKKDQSNSKKDQSNFKKDRNNSKKDQNNSKKDQKNSKKDQKNSKEGEKNKWAF